MTAADDVAGAVRGLVARGAPVVIALDGPSGSGKSFLAASLARRLGAAVVHVDDFYRDMEEGERASLSPREGVERYLDWQRLREVALLPLRNGEAARFQVFDWDRGRGLAGGAVVEPRDVVVVEGTYSARPEHDDIIDLKVLVETPAGLCARRRAQRHDPPGMVRRSRAAEALYFASVRPPSAFDLIVSGHDLAYAATVRRVRALLVGRLAGDVVAVVSRGDARLASLADGRAVHFPEGPDHGWAGHHPASSEEATAMLASARQRGVTALVVPAPSRWWLSHYVGFTTHLHSVATEVVEVSDGTVAFRFPALSGAARP